MRKSGPQGRRSVLVRGALLTALVLVVGAAPAHAHGQHELEVELFRGAKGPYELWVTAVPLVGFLEVAVTFEPDAPDAELGYSPRVVVSAARDGVRLGPKTATRAFLVTANDYSATFDPGAEGQWEVVINIDSERGAETLTLAVTVITGGGFPWTALIAGLGLVLPIVWLAWGAVRRKSRAKPAEYTMNKQLPVLGAVLMVALGLAACGSGNQESLTFDLSVVGGELSGESDTFVVKQGDDVTLSVSADIAGVFHVHGYDLRARVDANGSGTISFEADATGSFVIALHPSEAGDGSGHQASGGDIAIATLEVRPR